MKKILILSFMCASLSSFASMDADELKGGEPTTKELNASRACFKELKDLGCGHPSEDLESFRNCMHNEFSTLSTHCQNMMGDLYGKRK